MAQMFLSAPNKVVIIDKTEGNGNNLNVGGQCVFHYPVYLWPFVDMPPLQSSLEYGIRYRLQHGARARHCDQLLLCGRQRARDRSMAVRATKSSLCRIVDSD